MYPVGSARGIGPVSDFTVAASGRANEAARPISVEDVDANFGDRATHDIVHPRPAEGIGPFEAGIATPVIVVMNRHGMDRLSVIRHCDHDCDAEQSYPSQSSLHLKPPFLLSIDALLLHNPHRVAARVNLY
jgi:hypothetical protein